MGPEGRSPIHNLKRSTYGYLMATLWWQTREAFAADVRRADDAQLLAMYRWAGDKERASDAGGNRAGRNKKARGMFNAMTRTAATELERRGLSY